MVEKERYRKQICNSYGKKWKEDRPPKGDKCEFCLIKWKCRKSWGEHEVAVLAKSVRGVV